MDLRSASKMKPSGPSRRRVLACHPSHLQSHHPKKLGGSLERWPFAFSFGAAFLQWIEHTTFGFLEPRTPVVRNGEFLEYKGFIDMLPAYLA